MKINRLRFFNLGKPDGLREEDFILTPEQAEILEEQIRKNKERIEDYVALLDRLVNVEGYPPNHAKVKFVREKMDLLMEENNTFRQNFWRYWLMTENTAYSI